MRIIHANVVGVRRPLERKRSVEIEWIWDPSEQFPVHQTMHLEDEEGEFQIGDKIAVTLTKIM